MRLGGRGRVPSYPRVNLLESRRRRSEDEQLDAAADVELDPRHVRGQVGAEEGDDVRDLLRLARAAEGGPLHYPLVHGRVRHLERLRLDHARDDCVAGDPVPAALHRERLRQSEQPCLRRRVARLAEPAERAGDRRHVHDAAPAACLHVRPRRLGAVERSGEVHPQIALPQLARLLVELRDMVERARVVDEDVERPELVDGTTDRRVDLGSVGDVAADGERLPPHRLDVSHRLLGVDEPLLPRDRRKRAVTIRLLRQLRLHQQVGDDAVCQQSRRAASISVAMSAIMKLTPWCIAIGMSNVTRPFAYSTACSYAACATPTAPVAVPGRVKSSVAIAILNPSPSSPRRFSTGTRTSWSANADVSVARCPILSRCCSMVTPGASMGTMNADIPLLPAFASVFAKTTVHAA